MKPKMILFDYGQTLVVEPQFDAKRGYGAVYDKTDGGRVSRERFADFADAMFLALAVKAHAAYHEIDDVRFLRSICTYCGMQPQISFEEADLLYWDTATDGSHASPHAAEMLDALDARGIRTGVVSNLCFAKENLMTRLARYLPGHRFDPVAASSELLFRKPEAFIFNYALRAANLTPADVWFVGDNPTADILGASEVGMRPILYTGAHMRDFDEPIAVPHTRIDDLAELIRLVDEA